MKIQTEKGRIRFASDVFTCITGAVATSCYGVKGMAVRSKTDGLVHLLRRESMSKGVKVINHEDGAVTIDAGGQALRFEKPDVAQVRLYVRF